MRMKEWVRLIRKLPEGTNELPLKMGYDTYRALFNTCSRESRYDTPFNYNASYRGGTVSVLKFRKDAEPGE